MLMLYDSDNFVVVYIDANASETVPEPAGHLPRPGFEIVDKRSNKELYLDGDWAQALQNHIDAWSAKTPTQEEVEETLGNFSILAQNPLAMH